MADKLNALAKAPVNALNSLYDLYQRRVGQPFQQAVRGGVRGYFGLPMMSDADALGREAYRQAEALGYTPGVGMPAGAVRLAAEGMQALPSIAGDIGRVIAGMPSGAGAAQAEDFARYQRSIPPSDVSPLTAFHGTPYTFEPTPANPLGEFRAAKIGSGEGAQAFGHGLYFAESPTTAGTYAISRGVPDVEGMAIKRGLELSRDARVELMRQAKSERPALDAAKMLQNASRDARSLPVAKLAETIEEYRDASRGRLYTVDIPDSMVEKMLDWDKPLSEQPKSFQDMVRNLPRFQDPYVVSKTKGGEAYKELSGNFGGPAKASEMLRQAGIPGIRYLDAGSRNIVVFPGEENKVKILKRE
jgi:hypothetical protein